MVERRRFGDLFAHPILLLGVAIVAFPVYLCFVGSTHEQTVIANGQMPITPGAAVLRDLLQDAVRRHQRHHARAGQHHAAQQLRHGVRHRGRQDRHLDHLLLCRRLLQVPVPHGGVLADLHDADAARRGAHLSDLQDRRRPQPAQFLRRPHHPADRLGHRHAVLPPVLHDHPRRADRGLQARRRRAVPLLQGYGAAAVAAPTSPRCS